MMGGENDGIHPLLNLLSIFVLLLIHTILIPPPVLIASGAFRFNVRKACQPIGGNSSKFVWPCKHKEDSWGHQWDFFVNKFLKLMR